MFPVSRRGASKVRDHGWLPPAAVLGLVLSGRRRCHVQVNDINRIKTTGRRRRGRTGLGARRPLQIMILYSGVSSSTSQAEAGSSALPFTSAWQLLENNTEDASDRNVDEPAFVYRDPLWLLQTRDSLSPQICNERISDAPSN